mgnify:CR=1 FL=1
MKAIGTELAVNAGAAEADAAGAFVDRALDGMHGIARELGDKR